MLIPGDRQKTAFLTSKMSNFANPSGTVLDLFTYFPKENPEFSKRLTNASHKVALYFKCIEDPGVDYWLYCAQIFRTLKSTNPHELPIIGLLFRTIPPSPLAILLS